MIVHHKREIKWEDWAEEPDFSKPRKGHNPKITGKWWEEECRDAFIWGRPPRHYLYDNPYSNWATDWHSAPFHPYRVSFDITPP